ncbi:MAG: hypothetical protein KDD94_08710 [Calditrichaeota bacterium]|nr:hypothetical protein [Calditrichota bacterium]
MTSRKGQKRDILNSIRLTMLDWDPMELFALGQAGIEEYDEYIPPLTKALAKINDIDELEQFLHDYARDAMAVKHCDQERTRKAAEKLLQFTI